MKSSNPVLGNLEKSQSLTRIYDRSDALTIAGVFWKTLILLAIVCVAASWSWSAYMVSVNTPGFSVPVLTPIFWGSFIGALVLGLITSFAPGASPYTAPLYAACEGVLLGAISAPFEFRYPGIVSQAVVGTLASLLVVLFAYRTGIIRVTTGFRRFMMIGMFSIMAMYLAQFVITYFFKGAGLTFINSNSTYGILFSVGVTILASLNFALDFDLIESQARQGTPKKYEWYCSFALLVTIVWVYLEILRLISKLRKD